MLSISGIAFKKLGAFDMRYAAYITTSLDGDRFHIVEHDDRLIVVLETDKAGTGCCGWFAERKFMHIEPIGASFEKFRNFVKEHSWKATGMMGGGILDDVVGKCVARNILPTMFKCFRTKSLTARNVDHLILPFVQNMRPSDIDERYRTYVDLLPAGIAYPLDIKRIEKHLTNYGIRIIRDTTIMRDTKLDDFITVVDNGTGYELY